MRREVTGLPATDSRVPGLPYGPPAPSLVTDGHDLSTSSRGHTSTDELLRKHGAKEYVNPRPRPRLRRSSRAAITPAYPQATLD
jgi:hypothetical protein